jgi:Tfp pilus assembly protein PilV
MIRGRVKQFAVAAGASVLIAAGMLAVVPLTASAHGVHSARHAAKAAQLSRATLPAVDGGTPTTVNVTTHPGTTVTGRPLTISAQVFSVTGDADTVRSDPAVVPTGTISFMIVGSNDSTIDCKTTKANVDNTATISRAGKAVCKVGVEELQAIASPYSISATYSGDSNFAGNTGTDSLTVNKATTHTRLRFDTRPSSDSANTFTAHIKAGKGGSLLTGYVLFSVSDTPAQPKSLRTCAGGDKQPIAVTGNVGTATCVLQAGWFIVPSPSHRTPHPHGAWNVSATYSGDGNFNVSVGTRSGHANS